MEKLGRPSLLKPKTDELNARELILSILRTAIKPYSPFPAAAPDIRITHAKNSYEFIKSRDEFMGCLDARSPGSLCGVSIGWLHRVQ